jgi:hypothetical protein
LAITRNENWRFLQLGDPLRIGPAARNPPNLKEFAERKIERLEMLLFSPSTVLKNVSSEEFVGELSSIPVE